MQILEFLFLINGLKNVNGHLFVHDICNVCIIYPHFDISKTDTILQFFSQFSKKFLQIFLGNRFTCMIKGKYRTCQSLPINVSF